VTSRPAETSAPIAVAIAYLLGRAFDLDGETVGYLSIVVAFVPFAVSWSVDKFRRPPERARRSSLR
jgi:hypothetical protein